MMRGEARREFSKDVWRGGEDKSEEERDGWRFLKERSGS